MRIGIIGLGSIGQRHVHNALALGCQVHGWDLDPAIWQQVSAQIPGLEVPPAAAFDAVLICTPWNQHLALAQQWITAGVPTWVEKPLGPSTELDAWRALATLAVEQRIPTQVGYQLRFHPAAQQLHALNPHSVVVTCEVDMATWPGRAYGPLLYEASHELDLALWCGGGVVRWARRDPETDSYAIALSHGHVYLADHRPYWRRWSAANSTVGSEFMFTSPAEIGDDCYRDALAHFLDCVRERRQTDCPLSDGVRVLSAIADVERRTR